MHSQGNGKHRMRKYCSNSLLNDLELCVLMGATFVLFLYYNVVSHLTSFIGVNTAPYLITPLDKLINYTPIWVIFYYFAFVCAKLVVLLIRIKIGPEILVFRKMIITIFSLLLINFLLYFIFPCSVIEIFHVPTEVNSGEFLDSLVKVLFTRMAPWNANPSLHAAFCWLIYRFLAIYYNNIVAKTLFLSWFMGMILGTLTLKVHVIINDVLGILLAEICFRYIYTSNITERINLYLNKLVFFKRFGLYLTILSLLKLGLYFYNLKIGKLTILH